MLIRAADPARDGAPIAAIYAPFVTDSAISFEERAPDGEEIARRIERGFRAHPWLVAEDEGVVAGYAYGSPHRQRAAYRWSAEVSVYVDEQHRRAGIGRALYAELLSMLQRQGFHVACAGITLPNAASVALHEALGFAPVGIYRRIGFKHGRWWDVGWWQAELTAVADEPPAEPQPPGRVR